MRFGGIDPVYDIGFGVPESCDRCGKPVEVIEHPTFFTVARRTSHMTGQQWTCGCCTWGPA